MRKKIVAGNWKMNGDKKSISALISSVCQGISDTGETECVVFPPSIYLPLVSELLQSTPIKLGAQNVYPQDSGAYTGEVSGTMLNDFGCHYVLTGHSERRRLFSENEKIVAEKFHHVKEHGMIPVLCIGETLAEREQGLTHEVLARQLLAVSERDRRCFNQCVIAYEPVWSIGTGQTASPEQVQEVHQSIRELIAGLSEQDATAVPLIYGGSVNEKNAESLFAMPDIDGGLIGGASLNAQQFLEIVKCIN